MKPWQNVLAEAGFPTEAIVLDFETFWDKTYTLSELSTIEYVKNSQFACTSLAWKILDGSETQFCDGGCQSWYIKWYLKRLTEKYGEELERITVVAQNTKFDCLILQEIFGITPRFTVDTIDLDKMWDARASHKLKDMAEHWHAPNPKGDTKQFKGKRWEDFTPEQKVNARTYNINDVEIEAWLFEKMMPIVVSRPAIELPVANYTLQMYLKPTFKIDMDLGYKIIKKMKQEMTKPIEALAEAGMTYSPLVKGAKNKPGTPSWAKRLEQWVLAGNEGIMPPLRESPRAITANHISGDTSFKQLLRDYLPEGEEPPMKPSKRGLILALAKDDEGTRILLSHPAEKIRLLMQARQAIQSWPLHFAKVENILAQAQVRDGLIGTPLGYHNAHTGRWGGAENINLQNLGGRGRGGKGTHPLIQQVRNMLCAPPGYVLGIGDYSKVEAVGLSWQAGQDDLTEAFRIGSDVYSDLATELFGFPVHKPTKFDPPPVAARLEVCRGFGKDAILGAGYGMGAQRFYERCYANEDLRPKFDDGTFDMAFIERVIKIYRTKYSKIPAYWNKLEKAWRWATKYKETVVLKECNLTFFHKDGATFIRLPSGRLQRYPHAVVGRDNSLRYHWDHLWGGTLTENIISASCRDLIAESFPRLISNGFWIALTVHDEIVCLLPEKDAETRLKEMGEIMCELPAWATGFPLSVDTCLSEYYKK